MAKSRLIAATVAVAGVGAEALAPAGAVMLTVGDYLAGASLALVPAFAAVELPVVAVALTAASAWFVAGPVGGVLLLAHRGPTLHLLAPRRAGRLVTALIVAGYLGALLPVEIAGPVTTGLAVLVASTAARRGMWPSAALAAALGATWFAAVVGGVPITLLLLTSDGLLIGAALVTARGHTRAAVTSLVVDLGPGGEGTPVVSLLAQVLADPGLELRFRVGAADWVDESGRPVPEPATATTTYAEAPGGGTVALLHGAGAIRQPGLEQAAAKAAALALDAARLAAEARGQAEAVRASGARLLEAADTERRALESRLAQGPLPRLAHVEQLLHGELRAEAAATRRDLGALASGLFPVGDLGLLVGELADRCPLPAGVEVIGETASIPETHRVALYFVVAEALANVAKHAQASSVRVSLAARSHDVTVTVSDDGAGGASILPTRGLAGLADRVEVLHGVLTIHSSAIAGTTVSARIPLAPQPS